MLIRFCLLFAAALIASAAAAQQPAPKPLSTKQQEPPSGKIGYVNPERVMQLSRSTRKSKQDLDDKYQRLVKEIDAGPQDQLERRRIALDEDIGMQREDALKLFFEKTNRIIRHIAMEENFDIVFLEAVYASALIDLTERVIKEFDAGK